MTDKITLAVQNLLYSRPLFEYIGIDEKNMNVLVLGWNAFSEVFIDQCLQAGQMDSHFLNIKVLTVAAENKLQEYLMKRPALSQFVNVNGSLNGSDLEIYAALNFEEFAEEEFISADEENLTESILNILADAPDEKYHYFMVSVGNEDANKRIAENIKIAADDFMPSEVSSIHYVSENAKQDISIDGILPVSKIGFDNIMDVDPELERMAYNAHLTWEDAINGDAIAELKKFKADRYNYLSSIALALSIKYKLADLGIVGKDYHMLADEFYSKTQNQCNQETVNRIIALEHRRWVLEKVTTGWRAPKFEERQKYYEDCIDRRSVKDKDNKIHPCIVRSSIDTPLSTGIYSRDRNAWDVRNEDRDACLDELDRMSVELHRKMLAKANIYKKGSPLEKDEASEIRKTLIKCEAEDKTMREWERFLFCIKNIIDGNWAYSKQYDRYKERFLSKLQINEHDKMYIETQIEVLSAKIWPVIEANLYRDYKMNDELLVKKIPFILTYNIHISLAMAFRTSSSLNTMNDTIFRNVASATVIKPESITYLLFLDDTARVEVIRQMIQTVHKYMSGKGINCKIDFWVTGLQLIHGTKVQQWKKCFERLVKTECINDYDICLVASDQEAVEFWSESLAKRRIDVFDGSTNLFQSLYGNGSLLKVIQDRYPYFEFDSKNKKFKNNASCKYLSYIDDHTYLGIEEMFGLVGAEDMEFNYPVLGNEYKRLWNIYLGRNRGNKARWKDNVRYSVRCWNIMCDTLENYDEMYPNKKIIKLDELQDSYKGYPKWNDILNILKELAGEGGGKQYLIPERQNGKMIGFQYSSTDIKGILTKAGDILEIYTYFTVCEKGWFDEVACGYRFRWEAEKVNNELDLVLTKGFQSLVVECKARSKLDQNFYFKLNSLVDMFGIGAHKVLLTTAKTDEGDNKMQQERGNMMGITTISEIDDIQEIAERFIELL